MDKQIITPIDSSKTDINIFSLFFTNMKESKKLLKTYERFINEFYKILHNYYKELTEMNTFFLIEDRFKSSIINSPIFQIGKSIKRVVECHINNLFSIISNENYFDGFRNSISNLSKILQESSKKFDNKLFLKNMQPIVNSINECYSNIESKIIDKYIRNKYNKKLIEINNESLDNKIGCAKFLEKTFLDFVENKRIEFFNDLKEMENKTIKVFYEM